MWCVFFFFVGGEGGGGCFFFFQAEDGIRDHCETGVQTCALPISVELRVGKATFDLPDVAILVALALGGPLCALLVAVPAMLQREWLRTVFDAATLVLQILAAGYVFQLFSSPLLAAPAFDVALVWGVLAAGCVVCLLDTLIGPALLWIK